MSAPLIEVRGLTKHYRARAGWLSGTRRVVPAVNDVSFSIDDGETLGLVGETGCGKSTVARALLWLEPPSGGEVLWQGTPLSKREADRLRRRAQIVFQDPYTSLPPRMRIGKILAEPLLIHGVSGRANLSRRVAELLRDVGLKPETARALPHELSGGQRQRVGIARALAVRPALIVADEAVSSLDVSVQAQILNLMKDLQERHRLAYLFISHDLGIVRYMSHRIAVMYLGSLVETASVQEIYERPLHPYTRALMSATPTLRGDARRRIPLAGEPPDPANPPSGCKFHPRCPMAQPVCKRDEPLLEEWMPGRLAACHFALSEAPPEAFSTESV